MVFSLDTLRPLIKAENNAGVLHVVVELLLQLTLADNKQISAALAIHAILRGQIVRQVEFVGALSEAMGVGVRQIDRNEFGHRLDRAAWEALTFSLKASTNNEEVSSGYQFRVPNWRDMITRHLTPALSQ